MSIKKVISENFCIGCGACTLGKSDGPTKIGLDKFGFLGANLTTDGADLRNTVCPFSDEASNETEIADSHFHPDVNGYNDHLGRFITIYAGSVDTGGYRERGSSGGFTSWILGQLLEGNHVDAVIHVKPRLPTEDDKRLFKYGVSSSLHELHQGAKSHYYPVEMSEVLAHVRSTPGRYAIVGVPCFIKAIRLLSSEEPLFRDRIIFTIGLFCGHLKSTGFAELLAWQVGIAPKDVKAIDFRTKIPGKSASNYAVTAKGMVRDQEVIKTKPMSEILGKDWGMGFFKYDACDYCDDISAETADVSVGDAWLPEYSGDYRGTNIVIVRNALIHDIVIAEIQKGNLALHAVPVDKVIASQSANVRHRKEDIAYRLHLKEVAGLWYPKKRIGPAKIKDPKRRRIQGLRIRFREEIPSLWAKAVSHDDLGLFTSQISPLIRRYQNIYTPAPTVVERCKLLTKRVKKKLFHILEVIVG